MINIDYSTLTPEVSAYIRTLEKNNQKLEKENHAPKDGLDRLESLNKQHFCLRKRMLGQYSEKREYVDGKQLNSFNETKFSCDAAVPELGKTVPIPSVN